MPYDFPKLSSAVSLPFSENAVLRPSVLMQMYLTADTKGMKGRLPCSVEFL